MENQKGWSHKTKKTPKQISDAKDFRMLRSSKMEKGGNLPDKYVAMRNMTPEEVWSKWTATQRYHFLADHFPAVGSIKTKQIADYDYEELNFDIKDAITKHVSHDKRYAEGGGMPKFEVGDAVVWTVKSTGVKRKGAIQDIDKDGKYAHIRLQNRGLEYIPTNALRIDDAYSSYAKGGGVGNGANGYVAMYKGKKLDVYASTTYEAQQLAAKEFKAKKPWEVSIYLAELNGKPYVHSTASFENGGDINN